MPRNAYLVGSVPLRNAQDVFETVSAAIGPYLLTLPDGETGEPERVGEIDQILADGGLLRHARRGGIQEASGAVATKIGDQNAIAGFGERRRNIIKGVRVIGETVEQDDGRTSPAAHIMECCSVHLRGI